MISYFVSWYDLLFSMMIRWLPLPPPLLILFPPGVYELFLLLLLRIVQNDNDDDEQQYPKYSMTTTTVMMVSYTFLLPQGVMRDFIRLSFTIFSVETLDARQFPHSITKPNITKKHKALPPPTFQNIH